MAEGTASAMSVAPTGRAVTPIEPILVETTAIACDGGDGPLGHPRVWLRLLRGETVCPYCSRRYVLRAKAGEAAGH